jgi:OOP family OmpA-OmpF porin
MDRGRRLLCLVAGLLVSLAVTPARGADPAGWYGGISLGHAKFGIDQSAFDAPRGDGGLRSSADRPDMGYKARLGYDFSNGLAVEAGYADFGKPNYGGGPSTPALAGSLAGDPKVGAFNVDVLGHLPVARDLAVFGKVGLLVSDSTADASAGTGSASLSERSSRALPGVGLGLNYAVTKSLGLRAEWEKYHRLGTDLGSRSDIDQLSVGVNLKFH